MGMGTYLLATQKPFVPNSSFSPVCESGDVAYQIPAHKQGDFVLKHWMEGVREEPRE